jgi:hypothetical protein
MTIDVDQIKWKSIYREQPRDGSKCITRRQGGPGYNSETVYEADTGTFRTYEDLGNRLVITVWKNDEWCYA